MASVKVKTTKIVILELSEDEAEYLCGLTQNHLGYTVELSEETYMREQIFKALKEVEHYEY